MRYFFLTFLLAIGLQVRAQSVHVVQRGETAERIAKKYGLTEDLLRSANPQLKVFYVGAKVNIPEKPKKNIVQSKPTIQSTTIVAKKGITSRNNISQSTPVPTGNTAMYSKNEQRQRRLEKWKRGFDIAGAVLSATSNAARTMASSSSRYNTSNMSAVSYPTASRKKSHEDKELLEELRRNGGSKFEMRNNPDGNTESWLYSICSSCSGDGRCSLYLGNMRYIPTLGYHDASCTSCHGTNDCRFCYGNGWTLHYSNGAHPTYETTSSSRSNSDVSTQEPAIVLRVCQICNGTGLIPGDESVGNFFDTPSVYCQVCGTKHRETTRHIRCSMCDGTGKY